MMLSISLPKMQALTKRIDKDVEADLHCRLQGRVLLLCFQTTTKYIYSTLLGVDGSSITR